jgi:hypothetical protein
LDLRDGASEEQLRTLEEHLSVRLPEDYRALLRMSNGAVGHGPDLFVIMDSAEEVPEDTTGRGAAEYVPGMIIIGSDGCGNVLGIDTRSGDPERMTYVMVDPICLGWDEIWHRAPSLDALFTLMRTTDDRTAG